MDLPADFLERITTGDKVALQLPDGRKIACEEPRVERDEKGVVMVREPLPSPPKARSSSAARISRASPEKWPAM